jgi:hypothetical protein
VCKSDRDRDATGVIAGVPVAAEKQVWVIAITECASSKSAADSLTLCTTQVRTASRRPGRSGRSPMLMAAVPGWHPKDFGTKRRGRSLKLEVRSLKEAAEDSPIH